MIDVIAFGGLLALAILFVCVPLLRRNSELLDSGNHAQENAELYREQEAALQLQLQNNEIDQQQYDELCAEQQRLLLMDTAEMDASEAKGVSNSPSTAASASGRGVLLIIALVLLPLMTFAIYRMLGAAPDIEITGLLEERASVRTEAENAALRTRLISKIEARLEDKPDHAGYLVTQARLLTELGQYNQASTHYRSALEIFPEDSFILAEYTQSEYMAAGRKFTPNVTTAMEKTLAIDPENSTVLGLQGVQAFEVKDYRKAIASWQAALRGVRVGSANAQSLQSGIAMASEALGEPLPGLSVELSLSPELQASPDQVIYVFARELGPRPMPVAVVRLQASDLPTTVQLDDSSAMPGGKPLSAAGQIEVVARVSTTGSVTASPGDLEGKSGAITLDGEGRKLSLVIDSMIPSLPPQPEDVSQQQGISVDVSLSPDLQASPDQVLFVYAKEVGARPMPLAIARLSAAELPTTVQLDDSMAMPGGKVLSSVEQVQVVARISRTGNAVSAPGDLVGESSPITLNGELQEVDITINKILP